MTRIKNYILAHEAGINRKALIFFGISAVALSVMTFLFVNKESMDKTDYLHIFDTFNFFFQVPLLLSMQMKAVLWHFKNS